VVAVGARTRMARLSALTAVALLACMLAGGLSQAAQGEPMWTTYHRDPARSGNDPDATNPITPTLAWQSPGLGAPIWGQPLVLGSRMYVATVGDKIYALEDSTGKVLWEKSAGVAVPSSELPCGDISPTVGIIGTPVIDASSQVIYAVADTWNASTKEAHHVLKGYSLSAGAEVLSTAVDPPGSDPKALLQRTALNLDAGRVVFGFGGNDGDCGEYRGTVVAAPESGGSPLYWRYQPASPSKSGGAVWGPSGPAVDGEGHIYASTGNPNPPGGQKAETYDYSDSVVELSSSLSQIGNFEPESWLQDSNNDADLGSAGPEPLPGGLLFQAGKNRMGYLIDETKLGEGAPAVYSHQVCGGGGSFGGDAFANGTIYVPCTDGVRALTYNQAARTFTALWQGPSDANGPPIVSGGLVWSVATAGGGGTKLYGLDPSTGKPRYTEALPSPVADHFASPSAAGGRLFLATSSTVSAYQIAGLAPIVTTGVASSIVSTTATLNATVNPNGSEVTKCEFEYGTTISYGSTAPCSALPGSGTSPVAVSAAISSLTANTTYHFRIVATNAGETSKGSDEMLKTASNAPTVVSKPASSTTSTTATLNATVNPNGSEVTTCEFEYGTSEAYRSTASCSAVPGSGSSPVAVSAGVTGLSANTTYHFRISATNGGGTSKGSDQTFTTLVSPPTLAICAPFATQTTATLCAKVNPNGGEVSECKFEYGPTNAYGSSVACVPKPGSGTDAVEVNGEITGLTANTTYHYGTVVTNPGGTSKGSDETFKTLPNPPTVVTGAASPIAQTTATLNAAVNPNGGEVSQCQFEYGTTNSYGSIAPCSAPPGAGTSPVEVSASVTSLTAKTIYHFRISATQAGGSSFGADQELATLPVAVLLPPALLHGPGSQEVSPFDEHKTPRVPDVKLASTSLAVSSAGTVSIKVSCPAGESICIGTTTLRTLNAVRAGATGNQARKRILTLATGSFTVAGGRSTTVKLHLTEKARTWLARLHVLRVQATTVAHDPAGAVHTRQTIVTIRATKPRRGRER
jgi:PQQ-like domain